VRLLHDRECFLTKGDEEAGGDFGGGGIKPSGWEKTEGRERNLKARKLDNSPSDQAKSLVMDGRKPLLMEGKKEVQEC